MNLKAPKLKFKFKKEDAGNMWKKLPLIAMRHVMAVVLAGAVFSLLAGMYYFYRSAYVLTQEEHEAFVSVREVNTKLFQSTLEFIEDNQTSVSSNVSNPFIK